MNSTELQILQALKNLDEAVKGLKTANPKPDLMDHFSRLDILTRELPPGTDPGLMHYLHKRSYEKARLFLEGRESENARGNCRHD
jgi:hypothetical protein